MASMDWAKTTAREDKKHLSFGIWCDLYKRFWLAVARQQAITWVNINPVLCRHMASIDHNKLNAVHGMIVWSYSNLFINSLITNGQPMGTTYWKLSQKTSQIMKSLWIIQSVYINHFTSFAHYNTITFSSYGNCLRTEKQGGSLVYRGLI